MIKHLAIVSGNEKVPAAKPLQFLDPKLLGQIRTVLAMVGGILITLGVINATNGEFTATLDSAEALVNNIQAVIGDFLVIISAVSSWFAKEKQ